MQSGISRYIGKGMSVAFADYDGDGLPDIFVTNDKIPNFLFHNLGNGKFEEVALEAGVALTDDGKGISAMGVDFRDYDNDGLPDIAIAALAGETFPLFDNVGKGSFLDFTYGSRIGPLSNRRSGWSPALIDFNNDGWKDLFVSGSHVNDTVEAFEATPYRLPNAIFVNAARRHFQGPVCGCGKPVPGSRRPPWRCVCRFQPRWQDRCGGERDRRTRGAVGEHEPRRAIPGSKCS